MNGRENIEIDPESRDIFTEKQLEEIPNGDKHERYTKHHVDDHSEETELVKTEEHMKFRHIDGEAIWDKKRIEWKYKEPLKDDQNIQDLEEYAEINLPADYTAFIREHNGATPKPRVLRLSNGRNVVLNRLLRVEADEIDNIKDCMDALRNTHRVANLLPFADDPFGNLFCFECSRQEMKGIVFWDHEKNDTVKICTTFTELVDNLCDEEA